MSWPSDSPVGATSNGTFLVTNRYDFMSRRVEKASAAGTNSFLYDGWNLVREDIAAAPVAVAIANADFADGLDGWAYSNVTADACGPQTVANFSSAGAWLEQDVGAVAGDEYVVSFRYHPFACGLAPGYGSYPWNVSASIGDATASTNGSYAPWAAWQGMSNFTFRLRPSVPGPLRIAVGGMPNPVVTHVSVSRLARTSKHYCWGLDLSGTLQGAGGIGGLLVQRHSNANTLWFSFCDANGNISDLLDNGGILDAHYEYDSYGNTSVSTGDCAEGNAFRFATKYFDQETAVYYFGFRYYKNATGSWLKRDGIGERGGENIYAFVLNNPICSWDSLGLQSRPYYASGVGIVFPVDFSAKHPDHRSIQHIDETKFIQVETWDRIDQFDSKKCACIIKRYKAVYEIVQKQEMFSVYVATPPEPSKEIKTIARDAIIGVIPLVGNIYSVYHSVSTMVELDKRAGRPDLRNWVLYDEIAGQNSEEKKLEYVVCYAWVPLHADSEEQCPVGYESKKTLDEPRRKDVVLLNQIETEKAYLQVQESKINLAILLYLTGR